MNHRILIALLPAATLAASLFAGSAAADETSVAVAANFTEPAREIVAAFEGATDHTVSLSFGSTGQLYTQIGQGAPFEVFLAADTERPARALEEGLAVEGSDFTYAIGRIVLYSADPEVVDGEATLREGNFDRLAIGNPETAPYGLAAVEAMRALGVYDALEPKLVRGNNIAQTFQFVESGNAELGFVAGSQVIGRDGSQWQVPADLYEPVRQDAVLLQTGADSAAATAFIEFLRGPEASAIIERYGYALANETASRSN